MRFVSHYSSSKANLYEVIASNGKRLLIECGCTWKKLLKAIDHDLSNIAGCLLTHEHRDHSKAVENVLEAGIDVYSSAGTFEALDITYKRHMNIIRDRESFLMDGFGAMPFEVQHDAAEPMGYVIYDFSDHEHLLFVTDTMMIKQRFALEFSIIALCCSYDAAVLHKHEADGDINTELAKRLLTSHMEKEVTKSYLRDCCNLGKCTEIHLLHMSGDNIEKERVRAEIEKEFFVKTLIAGRQHPQSAGSVRNEATASFEAGP